MRLMERKQLRVRLLPPKVVSEARKGLQKKKTRSQLSRSRLIANFRRTMRE